jgi:hypothetical protein
MRNLLKISLCLLVTSCGVVTEPDKGVKPESGDANGFATSYQLADPNCQSSTNQPQINQSKIYTWERGNLETNPSSIQGLSTDGSLSSEIIAGTWYGFHQKTTCVKEDGATKCDASADFGSSAKNLKICREDGNYSRESIEGVALTALAHLEAAHQFYKNIDNHEPLDRVRLLILPKVEKETTQVETGEVRRKFVTDNLTYGYFNGANVFTVYPKSVSAVNQGLWKNLNLWEVPWVLAHEFGHHVFNHHTGSLGSFENNHDHDHSLDSTPLFSSRPEWGQGFSLREVQSSELWSAINEGFADLFAHYASEEASHSLESVQCLVKNRDVGSDAFVGGRLKRLDDEVLAKFYSDSHTPKSNCEEADFHEIHTIGAIMARGIDQVFSAALGGGASRDKAALLLKWSESINHLRYSEEAELKSFVKQALSILPQMNGATCSATKKYFPAYQAELLENANCPL